MNFGKHTPTIERTSGFGTGTQRKFSFANGYGASVIDDGYGRESGLFELAVLHGQGDEETLVYDTPITDDVMGYLTEADVAEALDSIEALPPRP